MRLMIAAVATALATAAAAGPVSFANGWQEQRLSLFSSNDYSFGQNLGLVSEGSVSIAWSRVGRDDWDTAGASWTWTVDQSVPATDLSLKGGDDRNISLYFVFVPESLAPSLEGRTSAACWAMKTCASSNMPTAATIHAVRSFHRPMAHRVKV